jgi:hypothetical protein
MEFQYTRCQTFPASCKEISCKDILLKMPGRDAAGAAGHFPALIKGFPVYVLLAFSNLKLCS